MKNFNDTHYIFCIAFLLRFGESIWKEINGE